MWEDADATGAALALAFPDRVAQRRPGKASRFLLRNGTGATFVDSPALAAEPYIAIAETDGRVPEARIFSAAPVGLEELRREFREQITVNASVTWDAAHGVRATESETLGTLVLREVSSPAPDDTMIRAMLLEALRREGLSMLPWSDHAVRTRERLAFLAAHDPAWPGMDDATLLSEADTWLGDSLGGIRRPDDLGRLDLAALLLQRVPWAVRARLDDLAPTHFTAPTGSRLPIDYANPDAPLVRVRLQEMFGQVSTPTVLDGRVPLTLHLLSPANRPVQVTRDLVSFWRASYFDVRKDMKGRYPKHPWPEDPLSATPTRRRK
jgi:ATP-dependent helicase HrpB